MPILTQTGALSKTYQRSSKKQSGHLVSTEVTQSHVQPTCQKISFFTDDTTILSFASKLRNCDRRLMSTSSKRIVLGADHGPHLALDLAYYYRWLWVETRTREVPY